MNKRKLIENKKNRQRMNVNKRQCNILIRLYPSNVQVKIYEATTY